MSCWCDGIPDYFCDDCAKGRAWKRLRQDCQRKLLAYGKFVESKSDDLDKVLYYNKHLDKHGLCISQIPDDVFQKYCEKKTLPAQTTMDWRDVPF